MFRVYDGKCSPSIVSNRDTIVFFAALFRHYIMLYICLFCNEKQWWCRLPSTRLLLLEPHNLKAPSKQGNLICFSYICLYYKLTTKEIPQTLWVVDRATMLNFYSVLHGRQSVYLLKKYMQLSCMDWKKERKERQNMTFFKLCSQSSASDKHWVLLMSHTCVSHTYTCFFFFPG